MASLKTTHDATVFTYTLGDAYSVDQDLAKDMACASGGLYKHINDGGELAEAMSDYYKLYASGLGSNVNSHFTAWVEPYEYDDGSMGTTVGAPCYDRTVSPPVFIGVAAVDFKVDQMQAIAGNSYTQVLGELMAKSKAICTVIDKGDCILQALRKDAGWAEGCR